MFYTYLRGLVMLILWSINGNAHYHNTDKIPSRDENYILVAPHRTWWDPVYMAFATKPKQFIFMAKKELFNNRIFGWWIRMCGAFPIDREKPNASAIKYPINVLKKSDRSLIMFPSGSRHSNDVKNFGNPIDISDIKKMNDEGIEMVADRIQAEFQRLDEETKQWHNDQKPNPLWWFVRIPALILAVVVGILTIIFTFIASFIWNPDKKREALG